MKNSKDTLINQAPHDLSEDDWLKKKQDLLNRVSKAKQGLQFNRESLDNKKKHLISDIESLEEKNFFLGNEIKEVQSQLGIKRQRANHFFKQSEMAKKELEKVLNTERGVINELAFYETEKSGLYSQYMTASEKFDENIVSLDHTISDIGFIKGEIKSLIDKINTLEKSIPDKYNDVDNLDELFNRTIDSLTNLYKRAHNAEKFVKVDYYKNKRKKMVIK